MNQDTARERRHPRIGVHELRRDLRDADQDLYLLRAELESQRRFRITSNRLMSAMIIVAGGLTSALWLTLPARSGTSPSRRSEPAAVAPAAELAATPVEAATERGT
ncbi:MAG: hypothetical protein AB7N65_31370, partial [Vicinamibacterales bacterium]